MVCAICHTRKPRRSCPGVHGDICSLCCGNEREVTVDCPFDCSYLREARQHEHIQPVDPHTFPNQDIRVEEEFLEDHKTLLMGASLALARASLGTPGVVDSDLRDALDALIRTYRTLLSGVYYESRPVNALANQVFSSAQRGLEEFRKSEQEQLGMVRTRDADVLQILVFLQRMELARNNGRPRGRAFLDSLRGLAEDAVATAVPPASSLILPGRDL